LLPIFATHNPHLSIPEVCLHHTSHLVKLIKALALVDPSFSRSPISTHHAIVQTAVCRVVLATGGVLDRTGERNDRAGPLATPEHVFADALSDVEFIEVAISQSKAAHVASLMSREVVGAIKQHLLEGRTKLWFSNTASTDADGSPIRLVASDEVPSGVRFAGSRAGRTMADRDTDI
jgi:hypothetical protein